MGQEQVKTLLRPWSLSSSLHRTEELSTTGLGLTQYVAVLVPKQEMWQQGQ